MATNTPRSQITNSLHRTAASEYLKTGKLKRSFIKAGYSEKSALRPKAIRSFFEDNKVIYYLRHEMDRRGLNDNFFLDILKEGLNARNAEGEQDWQAIYKFWVQGLKMRGLAEYETCLGNGNNVNVNVVNIGIANIPIEEVKNMASRVLAYYQKEETKNADNGSAHNAGEGQQQQ